MEYLTITQVNNLARKVLEEYSVWIYGEISNSSPDKYYYKYFSMKDATACIACVIPQAKLASLGFKLEDGITVRAYGTLSVFERDGKFQFKAEKIEKDGEGDLQAKIEAIKERLQKEGLLDNARKRPIPKIPARIAVLTSKDGAAWKDFYKVISERYRDIEILLYDVLVQGDKAAGAVLAGLQYINTLEHIDMVIITRGGGSLEDLMPFNDEALARAIASSKYPVVSAVGHEKDISIADLVADLRASTPSNAAEMIAPHSDDLNQALDVYLSKMTHWTENAMQLSWYKLESIINKSALDDKERYMKRYYEKLDHTAKRLAAANKVYEHYIYIIYDLYCRIENASQMLVTKKHDMLREEKRNLQSRSAEMAKYYTHILENIETGMHARDPREILKKGYSIVTNQKGEIIKTTGQVKPKELITTQLSDGTIHSTILSQ